MKNSKHGSEGNVISKFERARSGATKLLLAALVVGVVSACDNEVPPVFEVPGTGSVEGLLFVDANRDGKYDPSAGDRLLPNVNVRIQERGTTQVIAGATGKTNASGRFEIGSVPVGTHDLVIDTTGVGSGAFFCQNPLVISVFLNETQYQEVAARGGCIITITEAELSTSGKAVTISGTVTSTPGQLGTVRMYVQDATSGIRIEGLPSGSVALGDVVEIAGIFGIGSESQLTSPKLNARVAGPELVPEEVTPQQIGDAGKNGAADPLNGRLVIVRKLKLGAIWGDGQPSTRNAAIANSGGNGVLRIESSVISFPNASDVVPGLSAIIGLNKCYDVTGIASNFNALGELFPRTLADIKEVSCN